MTSISTAALVTTDGRHWSWADLVDEFRPAIEAFARSRGIRDAADVASDVFAAALPKLDGFSGTSRDLRSFLFTIAHRRVADEHRRFYRRPERLTGGPPDLPAPGDPDDEVIDRQDARTGTPRPGRCASRAVGRPGPRSPSLAGRGRCVHRRF